MNTKTLYPKTTQKDSGMVSSGPFKLAKSPRNCYNQTMKETKIDNEIQKIKDKEMNKIPLKGLFIVTFFSLLATCFIYWYENHKFKQKMDEIQQHAKEHPIKNINQKNAKHNLENINKIYFDPNANDTVTKR